MIDFLGEQVYQQDSAISKNFQVFKSNIFGMWRKEFVEF